MAPLCALADYPEAVSFYTEALKVYPTSCKQEIAVCYANRGACHMKMVRIKCLKYINQEDILFKKLIIVFAC